MYINDLICTVLELAFLTLFVHSVISNSLSSQWTVAHQAPLSMEFFQARILEPVAIFYSRGSSWPSDWTWVSSVSCISRRILYYCTTWEALSFLAFCLTSFSIYAYNPTSLFTEVFLGTVASWDFPIEKGSLVQAAWGGSIVLLPLLCPWVFPAVNTAEILLILSTQIFPPTYLTMEPKEQQLREAPFIEYWSGASL